MVQDICTDTGPGTPERRAAIKAALAAEGAPAETTLRRLIRAYDEKGGAACAHKKPSNAGEPRAVITRDFDKAFRVAGHPEGKLREIAAELAQFRKDIWASPARRSGDTEVRRRLEHELEKLCANVATPLPPRAIRLTDYYASQNREFEQIDIWKHDAKRFHDSMPHIVRRNLSDPPMTRIVADVKHLDLVLTRPAGSEVWPKIVGFLDRSTGRVFLYPLMLAAGEGVRQEHVIEGFLAMVEAWGFPQGLYLDNGSEFSCFDRIQDCFSLVNEEAGREIIYARAYNAKANLIEAWFKLLDQYLFKVMPGYSGSDRMNKKTAKVGRPTQPYPHSWERFCADLEGMLRAFHCRPIGGEWGGRSPDDVYREGIEAGWRPILVDTLILDAAFSRRETRTLGRGGLIIKKVRHHHPELDRASHGTTMEIAFSWRRGAPPLFRLPGAGWAVTEPDYPYHPEDKSGARESGRRARSHVAAVRARAAMVRPYDPVVATIEMGRRHAVPALPASATRLGGGGELIDLATGRLLADADHQARADEAERARRMEEFDNEYLEARHGRAVPH